MMRSERVVLIISGMHRSGTSLVAHYLQECGLFIGNTLVEPDVGNPLGYYEDQEILEFHRNALRKAGMDAFQVEESKLPIRVDDSDRRKAIELIARRSRIPQWGWKEPRTTLFLDFWDGLIENARYLFLIRHPLAVTDSLLRRGTDKHIVRKPIIGLRAWRIYNQQIQRFSLEHPQTTVICEIDDVIDKPDLLHSYLVEQFGLKLDFVPFDKIFVEQAFRSGHSKRVKYLRLRHFVEYWRCVRLYCELQEMKLKLR